MAINKEELDKELIEVKKSLIGFIDEVSTVSKNAPEKMAGLLGRFNTLQSNLLKLTTLQFPTNDPAFLQRAAKTLDEEIKPFLIQNKALKASPNKEALANLKEEAKQSITPRMGRSG